MTYAPPRPLRRDDNIEQFVCGSAEQTKWLLHSARQAHSGDTNKVFVVTESPSSAVVAYYGWCMSAVITDQVPERLRKGTGRYPLLPLALITRLGVHQDHEGQGLGSALLKEVLQRAAYLSEEIGCRGLLIHAESDKARQFYTHLVEFEEMPESPFHLVVLMKDVRRYLREN